MRFIAGVAALLVVADVVLLLSGYRVLIGEQNDGVTLRCRYFTGRSVLVTEYWYAQNNFMGRDECRFLERPE